MSKKKSSMKCDKDVSQQHIQSIHSTRKNFEGTIEERVEESNLSSISSENSKLMINEAENEVFNID